MSSTRTPTNYSISFNGDPNSYILVPSDPTLNLYGDFTIEWWQYQTDSHNWPRIWEMVSATGSGLGFDIESGNVYMWYFGSSYNFGTINTSDYKDTWIHFALVRSSGDIYLYKNGTVLGNPFSYGAPLPFEFNGAETYDLYIGIGAQTLHDTNTDNQLNTSFGGYIYNFEWLPGIVKYNYPFTPNTILPSPTTDYALILSGNVAIGPTPTYSNTSTNTNVPVIIPPISTVCFVAGTKIKTDQGIINIEKMNEFCSVNGKPVVAITRNVTPDKYLICIEKDALYPNMPSEDTVLSYNHKVLYKGTLVAAGLLRAPGVKRVPYKKEVLYNVLLDNYAIMSANNMIVETLHPDNILAKMYREMKGKSLAFCNELVEAVNKRTVAYLASCG
jgi:hypothetical protein